MAQEQKAKKPSKFIGFFKRIGTYFKEMWGEVKKLSWLSWKDLAKHTGAVIVFVLVMAVVIYVLDTGFSAGVQGLSSLNPSNSSTTQE